MANKIALNGRTNERTDKGYEFSSIDMYNIKKQIYHIYLDSLLVGLIIYFKYSILYIATCYIYAYVYTHSAYAESDAPLDHVSLSRALVI